MILIISVCTTAAIRFPSRCLLHALSVATAKDGDPSSSTSCWRDVCVVPAGSPSRGGDAAVYFCFCFVVVVVFFHIKHPSLPTPFYSVLVSASVFMALSTVFYSRNPPDNSSLSHSVLSVLYLFALLVFSAIYLFKNVYFSPDVILCG